MPPTWSASIPPATRLIAFTLSALFCGTVGAAYASWTGYIDPTDSFSILMTIKVPVMCLLGGAGTVLGPVVGTAAFMLLEEVLWANFLDYNRAILGARHRLADFLPARRTVALVLPRSR